MRLRAILFIGILVCFALYHGYHIRPFNSTVRHDSISSIQNQTARTDQTMAIAQAIPSLQANAVVAPGPTTVSTELLSTPPQPNKYHGQPIGTVFTDLDSAPADWREFNPESLNLILPGGKPATYRLISVKSTSTHTLWFGYDDTTKGWLSAVSTPDSWNAELMTPGASSHRIYAAKQAVVTSGDPSTMICADIVDHALREAASSSEQPVILHREAVTDIELANLNISTVGVLYDQDTENDAVLLLSAAGSSQTPENAIRAMVMSSLEYANIFLYLSEVDNLEWELGAVGKMQPYDRTGQTSMNRDLDIISTTQSNAGIYARQFFTTNHADQGVLIVGGDREEDGLGESPGNYSVVAWYRNTYLSILFAHEMAHNFGCRHDRASYNDPLNNGLYNYGHTYELDYDSDGTVESYGTIMSYGGDYISPQFSNPDVDDEGVPTGVPEDQPNAANNARQLREHAAAISGHRIHPQDAAITTQPVGRAVTIGQTLTLSVTASGPNLSYQWYKDNQKLPNATSSTYTKSNAQQVDAGSYVVTATNSRRTALSSPASISITTASQPSTGGGATSGGGGGGGGGAPSLWFIAALSIAVLRRMTRRG